MPSHSDIPPDAGTGLHDRLTAQSGQPRHTISAEVAEMLVRNGPPPFRPGSPAWLAGWQWRGIAGVAKLQALGASLGNDDAGRAIVAQCVEIIRNMKPEAPK